MSLLIKIIKKKLLDRANLGEWEEFVVKETMGAFYS
jgi:hypothetical protein